MPPISNIYDIYNQVQETDKPFVDQIVAAILQLVEENVALNKSTFLYEPTDIIAGLELVQVGRIIDRTIAVMREKGIRCGIDGQPKFSNVMALPVRLKVWWPMRDNREYMKAYC